MLVLVVGANAASAQMGTSRPSPSQPPIDSTVTIAAGKRYQASALHRWFAGSDYRDLWATSMRVPVLDLNTFAGGLHATKEGGGNQTKSLRFKNAQGDEWVFRLTDKTATGAPAVLKGTPVDGFLQDQVSAMHPAGAQMSGPIMDAVGVLHPTPRFMVMPNDTSLEKKWREQFAGRLGIVEEFPNVPEKGPGFAGASKIIDSEELLKLLDTEAKTRIDARQYLAARLADFLINDNDRHEDNWKWARLEGSSKNEWIPIARDRDHAFVSYDGALLSLSRLVGPSLVFFGKKPNVAGLTQSGPIDERLLSELEKPVWDSVAKAVQRAITDSVLHVAVERMPPEYQSSAPAMEATLRARRDALTRSADQFYRMLAARVLVHGTDSSDHAFVARSADGIVDVRLESGGKPFYARRFDAHETSEILVYLHGGNDSAVVTGNVEHSIKVRVIGGNGYNVLLDSSTVGGESHPTRLYENGEIRGVSYGPDTMFDRRPWENINGRLSPPLADHGSSIAPVVGIGNPATFGVTPRLGIVRTTYGFDHRPYSSMIEVEGQYAPEFQGMDARVIADKRLEGSPLHVTALASVSDFSMVGFHGFGNATVDANQAEHFYEVHDRQWVFNPSMALAIGQRMDIAVGPVIEHSVTDSTRSPFLATARPYGLGTFNEAGVNALVRYDWTSLTEEGGLNREIVHAAVGGAYYPAIMDVRASFEKLSATLHGSTIFAMPTQPELVALFGATKVFGDFPYFEAATIGSDGTMRYLDPDRYAGDASTFGTTELRLTLTQFHLVLPLRAGIVGVAEAGRVFVDRDSPGGWHTTAGEGIWLGMRGVASVVTFVHTTGGGIGTWRLTLGLN
jgi:hypothetical protein